MILLSCYRDIALVLDFIDGHLTVKRCVLEMPLRILSRRKSHPRHFKARVVTIEEVDFVFASGEHHVMYIVFS